MIINILKHGNNNCLRWYQNQNHDRERDFWWVD
jgi:hypothetical protein